MSEYDTEALGAEVLLAQLLPQQHQLKYAQMLLLVIHHLLHPPSTVPTKTLSLNPTNLPTVSPANLHTSSPVVEVNLSDAAAHCPGNSDVAVANKYFSVS